MFARFWILCLLVLLITLAKAQDKSVIYPTTSAASATVLPDGYGYVYIGCCNETTGIPAVRGARALSGGSGSPNNTMTTVSCLEYCSRGYDSQKMQYAGLEYGRECYFGHTFPPCPKSSMKPHVAFTRVTAIQARYVKGRWR
ncbi:hypothetical protein M433DRAFT_154169 [Acidomyces richmondensis BFW]|nr:MAG: hypothetical protein FE78DRAFT_94086 [Acidomyces sp. 'richmondensis']KYG45779.1 hypothetical protein M433DRAFT_154169 [Acidomyces richmondensis BFW]